MSCLESLWNDERAAAMSEAEMLLYRSNLLGSDLRITNFGGGNTSAKIRETDFLTGEQVDVLWVKGSGGDLRSMKIDGFSTLYLDKLLLLKSKYGGVEHEDSMVDYYPHCTFNLNPRPASIDTPLHAFIPRRHVDHMHPDSVIAIACARESESLTRKIFGERLGWLPWQRPGFDLGVKLGDLARANPSLEGVVLQGHGLFTWGDSAKECYLTTVEAIRIAADWLESRSGRRSFGAAQVAKTLDAEARRSVAAKLMPLIRGGVSRTSCKIGHFDDRAEVLEFIASSRVSELASLGTSCPDHFLRTKIRPLVLDMDSRAGSEEAIVDSVAPTLRQQLARYRDEYAAYYERCKHADSPAMRDSNAVVYLAPGIGMFTFAVNKATARIAAEFYVNAINVMRGAELAGGYVGLPEQEAFEIEYWLLEEAKLKRMPPPRPLSGKVALVTGAAGGIGVATARRLLADGACVVLADIDESSSQAAAAALASEFSDDVVSALRCDVTSEESVRAALAETCVAFGGLDILVSNAGIASAASIEDTSLELWERNLSVLTTGYFLVTREAYRVMRKQGCGGAVVFVASKNSLVASANAAAYCTAKGAELQLARVVALEGAPHGIRCNVVNPDAVLRGSKIWSGKWRRERAEAYEISENDLDEHYRQRSLLKLNVLPEDVAEAVAFFASDRSAKSTGNIINVDAGHAPAFTR